jgi:hypothetical protein
MSEPRPNIGKTLDALQFNPALIFLVVLNLVFLGASIWFLSELLVGFREVNMRRDELVRTLANKECFPPPTLGQTK